MGSYMHGRAALDMEEVGLSGTLGLDLNIKAAAT